MDEDTPSKRSSQKEFREVEVGRATYTAGARETTNPQVGRFSKASFGKSGFRASNALASI